MIALPNSLACVRRPVDGFVSFQASSMPVGTDTKLSFGIEYRLPTIPALAG